MTITMRNAVLMLAALGIFSAGFASLAHADKGRGRGGDDNIRYYSSDNHDDDSHKGRGRHSGEDDSHHGDDHSDGHESGHGRHSGDDDGWVKGGDDHHSSHRHSDDDSGHH